MNAEVEVKNMGESREYLLRPRIGHNKERSRDNDAKMLYPMDREHYVHAVLDKAHG